MGNLTATVSQQLFCPLAPEGERLATRHLDLREMWDYSSIPHPAALATSS